MTTLTFTTDKKTVSASVGERIVDIAHKEHAGIPFGCQNGICGTCLSHVKKGIELLSHPSEKERRTLEMFGAEQNQRLACQCVIEKDGDIEIDN